MYLSIAITLFLTSLLWPRVQTEVKQNTEADQHIHNIINELPPNSGLRHVLVEGARGNGVHYSWMDELRSNGIKRVIVTVAITFDRNGRPKQLRTDSVEYFSQYDGGTAISDSDRLSAIRASGLQKQLETLALEEAPHGMWTDVPRPAPKPFIGSTQIQFYDDEWLPGLPTMYSIFRRTR